MIKIKFSGNFIAKRGDTIKIRVNDAEKVDDENWNFNCSVESVSSMKPWGFKWMLEQDPQLLKAFAYMYKKGHDVGVSDPGSIGNKPIDELMNDIKVLAAQIADDYDIDPGIKPGQDRKPDSPGAG